MPLAQAEEARAIALALVPGGFEELEDGDSLTLALYVDESAVASIRAVFADTRVASVAPGWEDAWRTFHRPVRAGGLWIGPPWERPDDGEPSVVIDPGRAFGTGSHPTTRLCIELLGAVRARFAPRRGLRLGRALDRGLAPRVRARAGGRQRPDRGRDDDRELRRQRRLVAARVLDGESDELPAADIAVANVLLAPVERILARLDARIAITSGYLAADLPRAPGWKAVDRLELDDWAADRFERLR